MIHSKYHRAAWAVAAAFSTTILAGCASAGDEGAAGHPVGAAPAPTDTATSSNFDAYALVEEYTKAHGDPDQATRVLDTIRGLTLEDARAFHGALADVNGITGEPLRLFQEGFEVAVERGVAFLDLDAEMRADAFRRAFPLATEVSERPVDPSVGPYVLDAPQPSQPDDLEKAICIPPFTSCTVDPNFDDGYAMFGASCASGCTDSSSVDRTSNESCELLGCDYRVIFPRPMLQLIGGRTAEGQCAVSSFPDGIGAYSTSSATFVVLGFNTILLNCGISGGKVHADLFLAFE
jgi:hypothetical protein